MSSGATGHVRERVWTDRNGEERHCWDYTIELAIVGGRRQRRKHGGFRTKKLAEAALRRELTARESGVFVERSSLSFADYLNDTWLPMISQTRRLSTHANYQRDARLHVAPHLGSLALQDVRPIDVESLYLYLAKPHDGRGALGKRSLHNVATVVHGVLEHALRLELIARNPAAKITPPAQEVAGDDEVAHWSAEQVAAFLDHVDAVCGAERQLATVRKSRKGIEYPYTRTVPADPMQRALWYLIATTGLRRGEACGLQWPDIDLKEASITVRRARVLAGNTVVESPPKTRRGRRIIAVDATTIAVLREWRAAQKRAFMEYGHVLKDGKSVKVWEDAEGHVFTHNVYFTRPKRYGVVVNPDWVTGAFQRVQVGSGLPALHLHGLRHSWATAALEAGEHLRAVADHLGHADTAITDRVYTHTVRRVQDAAALRVAALISSKRAGPDKLGTIAAPKAPLAPDSEEAAEGRSAAK